MTWSQWVKWINVKRLVPGSPSSTHRHVRSEGIKQEPRPRKLTVHLFPQRIKMIDNYQASVLHRVQCLKEKRPKRHKCPVCRLEGHHSRARNNILQLEKAEQADKFLREVIDSQKIDSYISSLAKRHRHTFVKSVLGRIRSLSSSAKESVVHPRLGKSENRCE